MNTEESVKVVKFEKRHLGKGQRVRCCSPVKSNSQRQLEGLWDMWVHGGRMGCGDTPEQL